MTAAKDQALAVEHPRLRIVPQIDGHRVATTRIVDLMQTLLTDGNELWLIIGGAWWLCIPFHATRPQHIGLTLPHTVDIAFQLLIRVHRHVTYKVFIALDGAEGVITTVFRILCRLQQVCEHSPLQRLTSVLVLLQLPLAGYKYLSYYLSQTHLTCAIISLLAAKVV